VAQGASEAGAELPGTEAPGRGQPASHHLRERPVPEYLGMLGAADRHLHDPGRYLHAQLRVLRGEDGPAGQGAGLGRARARGRGRGEAGPAVRRDHLGQPGRAGRRRRADLRRDDQGHTPQVPGRGRGSAHPGFQGIGRSASDRARRQSRPAQPQPGDGTGALPDGAAPGAVRPVARTARTRESPRREDQDGHHGGTRRNQ